MKGQRLKRAIMKAGYKQRELAKELHVTETTISRWIMEEREPDDDMKVKLAGMLKTSLDYLMGNTDEPTAEIQEEQTVSDLRPLTELIPAPVASEEMAACLGNGIDYDDLYNNSERVMYIERNRLRAYDDMRKPFAITCHGDCLQSVGLMDSFLAIVNPAETPSNGNLALVSINGMLSIKFYARRPNGNVALSSDESTVILTPAQQEETEFFIVGAVVSFMPNRRPTKFF